MLLWRASGRYGLRHPWLVALSVLGVALGVAVVVAIDLANASAQRAFELSAQTVTGKATHQIVGAAEGLEADVYRRLRLEADVRDSAPVVEGYATYRGRTFQVLGVDPFAEAPFRPYLGGGDGEDGEGSDIDLSLFMAKAGTVYLSRPTSEDLGKAPGDTLTLEIEGVRRPVEVAGLLEPGDRRSAEAMSTLLLADVATAQELFGMAGRLSRIDLIVPEGPEGERVLADVRAVLPEGAETVRSQSRTETIESMTRAFRLNLTALSLLALLVGMFLIYNTMTFSVVQRRPLIGRLRALGVTKREVFGLVLGEALLIGAVGTGLGLLGGIVLGRGLVELVTQTINDLYYVLTVRRLSLSPLTLFKGVALGLGATMLAALAPAREAAGAAVNVVLRRSESESRLRKALPKLALGGASLGIVGAALLFVPGGIAVSYAALLCVLLAFALVAPAVVLLFAKAARPLMGRLFGTIGRMAARGIVTALSRTAVAIAALMVAIAATIGVGVMVDSFRQTVVSWLDYTLQADVYVQPPSLVFRRGDASLQPEVVRRLRSAPGVAGAYTVRGVEVSTPYGPTDLVAQEANRRQRPFQFKEGAPDEALDAFEAGEALLISEPYSFRHGLHAGDTLRLQTDRGEAAFPVAGVFYDYGSDLGIAMISRDRYEALYDDRGVSGMALYAAPGQDVGALVERLRQVASGEQDVIVRSNRNLREFSLDIFDRTFTITTVLRLLAVLVAFIGVLSALMALQLERARELAVLRATGLTPGELWRYVTMQTGLMGLVAGLLSIPLGLVLAYVLIFVINKRSFGWTLQFSVGADVLLLALGLALVAALLAGLYPSWKMARANPALALREE